MKTIVMSLLILVVCVGSAFAMARGPVNCNSHLWACGVNAWGDCHRELPNWSATEEGKALHAECQAKKKAACMEKKGC